jgi:serine/threonine protein kinase
MGEVYLAHDSRLNRNVALKILPSDSVSDATRKRRFTQEARAASALNHPNILTIHDFGTTDGISYLVSELIEGESLRKVIACGPVPIRRLLDIAIQIGDGLAAAHEAGILHRDLKPENIMVTPNGRVKLLDFGLAKPLDDSGTVDGELLGATLDGEHTQPGLIIGTVAYMSPEQARGLPLSFESDQFSFGVMLHEMATGQHPFRRDTPMETLLEIANLTHVPFTPGPVAFRLLVGKCLSRDPANRFSSTGEVLERLKRIGDELPDKSRILTSDGSETGSPAAVIEERKPRTWVMRILMAVLLFSLGLIAARVLTRNPGTDDFSTYKFQPLAPTSNVEVLPALSPNGKTVAYAAESDGVFRIFTQPLKSAVATPVTRGDDDAFFPFWDPSGRRIYYVCEKKLWSVGAAGGSPELVFDNVGRAAISPDGKRFALLRNDVDGGQSFSLWFAANGTAPKRYEQKPFLDKRFLRSSTIAFAPDGRLGIWTSEYNGASQFWVILDPGAPPRRYLEKLSNDHLARTFAWMPDSSRIVFTDGHLWMADLTSGSVRRMTAGTDDEVSPSIAPDGGSLAFAATDFNYTVRQISLDGNKSAASPSTALCGVAPAWSPAGPQYAYVTDRTGQPEIWLKDTQSGWERPLVAAKDFDDKTISILDVAFSPDGQRIAYRREAEGSEAIWVTPVNGDGATRLAREDGGAFQRGPTWSPDGNWIAYNSVRSGDYALMKAAADGSGKPLLIRAGAGTYPAWSPNGHVIATVAREGLNIVNADGSGTRHFGDGTWYDVAWSHDGNAIYGVRRSPHHRLELAAMDPRDGTESVRVELGGSPAALSYGAALSEYPVRGASISADGKTFLTSILDGKSSLWLLSGYKK